MSILVGGNEKHGIIQYIQLLGFYEGGGVANPYRINPRILVAILTNEISEELIELVKKGEAHKLDLLKFELEELEHNFGELKKKNEKGEDENLNVWMSGAKDLILKKIQLQKEESQKKLNLLEDLHRNQEMNK